MSVQPIPEGFHTVTPYLIVKGVPQVIEFLQKAFNATMLERTEVSGGITMHASLRIGTSIVMMGEGQGGYPPSPAHLYVYLEDVDAAYKRAIDAGGVSLNEPDNMFYGDRVGGVKDPSGNTWWIATRVEDVPSEELQRRAEVTMKKRKNCG